MRLLDPPTYASVQHLVFDAKHDLAVAAIVAGRAAGRVFVDNPDDPHLALASPHWGRLYILGRADPLGASAVADLMEEVIRPAASAAGAAVFTLAYPPRWRPFIAEVLGQKRAVKGERQYYRWAGTSLPRPALPEGFALVAADAALLASTGATNLQFLRDEMISERSSVDDFLAHSFGVAAVCQGRIAGFCLSEYNTDARCEVGIATLEPFQRQGLATAMGRAFLDMARMNGIQEVGWHCWKQNLASAATASAIGFEHVSDYPVYFGWYSEAGAEGSGPRSTLTRRGGTNR